jgi:hypothetical protein
MTWMRYLSTRCSDLLKSGRSASLEELRFSAEWIKPFR